MSRAPQWFINDRAIATADADSFNHDDIAGQLKAMVESIEAPATIGLIGGFGAGKSSVGNLLANKLKGHSQFQVVSISAEKHSDVARQRALVYSLAEALHDDAEVKADKIEDVLGRVEVTLSINEPDLQSLPIFGFARKNWKAFVKATGAALGVVAGLYIIGVLFAAVLTALGKSDENIFTWPINIALLYASLLSIAGGWIIVGGSAWAKGLYAINLGRWGRIRAGW